MFFKVDQDPTRNLLLQYLFWSVRYSLRCVKEILYAESEKTLQIKAGQNSVSVNQCFSLYNFFFFKPLLFLCRNRQSGRLLLSTFEENKTVFSSKLFFHSKWPDLTAKRQELGPTILRQRETRCKNGNVQYIRSKWREIIEVVQYCR